MSQILLTHSYFYRFDPKQWKAAQPYPPYGALSAVAVLRECGFEVSFFDSGLAHSEEELKPILERAHPRYLVLYDDGFNYLTKMCLTRMREAAFAMIRMGKSAGCTVIVSSSDSTDHFADYLAQGADFILLGEGEITLRELIMALENPEKVDYTDIPGLAYRQSGSSPEVIKTLPRPVLTDLDILPNPAWDVVNMEAYRAIWMKQHGYFMLNLATTRGCPYKCNWCAKPIYGNRYNSRSPERVVAELEFLVKTHGVTHFWMADDIFGLKPSWVQRFRDLILEKQLKIRYKIQSRVDLLLKEDTIEALAQSGCYQVWVGAESGSQKILDAMDKGTTLEEIATATRLLKSKGIQVCFFLQFGYLGETRQDIEATLLMLKQLEPYDIGISVSYPLPGTKFYENVRILLGSKQNWEDSDDLAMMYPATFSAAFYRRLHRLTHKKFRLQQGLSAWKLWLSGKKAPYLTALKTAYYAPAAWLDQWRLNRLEKINAHGQGV